MWYGTYHDTNGQDVLDDLERMKKLPEDELEGLRKQVAEHHTRIGRCRCAYCNAEVLSVLDDLSSSQWWGYLGNQARKPNTYRYSPIIRALRLVDDAEGKVWNPNPLYNVHSRIHTEPVKDYSIICSPNALHILCNECFQKTYKRIRIYRSPGYERIWQQSVDHCEISVLKERGETVESVLKDLRIDLDSVTWAGRPGKAVDYHGNVVEKK